MGKFAGLGLAVEQPSRMVVKNPVTGQPLRDGEGKEAFVLVYSSDSEVARNAARAAAKRRLDSAIRTVTAEDLEADALETIVALTAGWYLVGLDRSPLEIEYSPENARELYSDPSVAWLREQVDRHSGTRANFAKAS